MVYAKKRFPVPVKVCYLKKND